MRVGFVGLGHMGMPMARKLVGAGFSVIAYDVLPDRLRTIAAEGAVPAASVSQLGAAVDVAITMLPTNRAVESTVVGDEGLATSMNPGSTWVDMGTTDVELTRALGQRLNSGGVHALDAPVTGGVASAEQGRLTVLVGGDEGILDRCRPVLEAMAQAILHVGPHGCGQVSKIVNNLVLATNVAILGEAFALGVRAGVAPTSLYEALEAGSADSFALRNHIFKFVLQDRYDDRFPTTYMSKDIELALSLARREGLPLPLGGVVAQLLNWAIASGNGNRYFPVLAKMYSELAGFTPGSAGERPPR